jgi:hypothetical protein
MSKQPVQKAQVPAPDMNADDGLSKRIEEIRAKRQQRGTREIAGKKLSVDTSRLDARYEYRWTNDEPGRLAGRQAEATFGGDWEFVKNDDGSLSDGRNVDQKGTISRIVDKTTGQRAYLMRKPKELYGDDQATKMQRIKQQEEQMKREGVARGAEGLLDKEASKSYAPKQVAGAYRP